MTVFSVPPVSVDRDQTHFSSGAFGHSPLSADGCFPLFSLGLNSIVASLSNGWEESSEILWVT